MKKNLTILYVEDESLVRQQAVEYLSRRYTKILEAKNGLEALEIYRTHKPDIIISDIKMPKMNGLEMARVIRQEKSKIPIIIATAFTQTDFLLDALALQLIKYIVKPITAKDLEEALSLAQEHLEKKETNIIEITPHTIYDTLNRRVFIDKESIKLTHNELLLLDLLAKHHQRVVVYEEIEALIWAYEGMSMDALRSLVRPLRKKLQGNYIENVSGIGYRLKVEN